MFDELVKFVQVHIGKELAATALRRRVYRGLPDDGAGHLVKPLAYRFGIRQFGQRLAPQPQHDGALGAVV